MDNASLCECACLCVSARAHAHVCACCVKVPKITLSYVCIHKQKTVRNRHLSKTQLMKRYICVSKCVCQSVCVCRHVCAQAISNNSHMNAQLHVWRVLPVCLVVSQPPCRTGPEGFVGNEKVTVMAAWQPGCQAEGWVESAPRQHELK